MSFSSKASEMAVAAWIYFWPRCFSGGYRRKYIGIDERLT